MRTSLLSRLLVVILTFAVGLLVIEALTPDYPILKESEVSKWEPTPGDIPSLEDLERLRPQLGSEPARTSPTTPDVPVDFGAPMAISRQKQEEEILKASQPEGLPAFRIYKSLGVQRLPSGTPCAFYRVYNATHRDWDETYYPDVGQKLVDYWRISATDLERCKYEPLPLSWTELVLSAVESLTSAAGYGDKGWERDYQVSVLTAYGLLQVGGGIFDGERALSENFRRQVLPQFYRSPALLEATYHWVKPNLEATFLKLPANDRTVYLEILVHAENYLAGFDYAAERAYLGQLEQGKCSRDEKSDGAWYAEYWKQGACTHLFTRKGPDGHETPLRKLQAWIFRRVHTDKVPVEVMLSWVRRFRADLLEVHKVAQ